MREPQRQYLKAGDILNRKFRIERLIGEGGMGVVVSATHLMLEQAVAIKLLNSDDPESAARLTTEARNAAKLQSEHVARVKDVEIGDNGNPYIVMELLAGIDLDALLAERKRVPAGETVDYMLEALEGMAEAHARGIIHRDLKPSNLFLATVGDRQIIKILDFGVSKTLATNQGLTGKGAVLGSPPYMSPEQVRAPKTLDHRSDIWSLGVVLYELLTGELPFLGEEVQETFALILERPVPPFSRHRIEAPPGLEAVVMRCLEKDRNRRYYDVSELAQALAPYAVHNGASVQQISRTLTTPPDDPTTAVTPSHIRPKRASSNAEAAHTPSGVFIPNPTSADGPSTLIGKGHFIRASESESRLRQFAEWAIWVVPGMAVAIAFAGFLLFYRAKPVAAPAAPPPAASPYEAFDNGTFPPPQDVQAQPQPATQLPPYPTMPGSYVQQAPPMQQPAQPQAQPSSPAAVNAPRPTPTAPKAAPHAQPPRQAKPTVAVTPPARTPATGALDPALEGRK